MARSNFLFHLLALAVVAVWGVTFVCTKELISAGLKPAEIFVLRFLLAYIGIWILSLLSPHSRPLTRHPRRVICHPRPVIRHPRPVIRHPRPDRGSPSFADSPSPSFAGSPSPSFAGSDRRIPRLWSKTWQDELLFVFLGVTGGSLYFLTENTALAYTQASNVAFLVCTAPLFTALFTLVYKRIGRGRFVGGLEDVRLGFPLIAGTLLALGGMALMLFDGARLQVSLRGDLLSLAAAVCWALYSLYMSQLSSAYGTVFATRKVFAYGLLTILPFLGGTDVPALWATLQAPVVWSTLLFLSLVASLACFVLWNLVMSRLGNVSTTNYVYLNPVFTLISAMILLGERLTPAAACGSALILLGVILAGQHGHHPSPEKEK